MIFQAGDGILTTLRLYASSDDMGSGAMMAQYSSFYMMLVVGKNDLRVSRITRNLVVNRVYSNLSSASQSHGR